MDDGGGDRLSCRALGMQTRGTLAHTPPHYATPCPTNTNFDARRSAGMGRQEHLEARRLFIAAPSTGELLKKRARNHHHLPERAALRARHAIIQITDSISLSVMCKCDLISTYPPSPSSPIYQDQLGAFFCLCDSCGANFFPAPAEKDKSRKKHSAMPYSSGGCSLAVGRSVGNPERECH